MNRQNLDSGIASPASGLTHLESGLDMMLREAGISESLNQQF